MKGRGTAWRLRRGSRERRSLIIPRERSSLVARGTGGPAHSRKARSAFRTTTELVRYCRHPARHCRTRTPQGAMRPRRVGRRTRRVLSTLREIGDFPRAVRTPCVLPTLPDDVRQAARIRRILAPSRESSALERQRIPGSEATGSPRAVRAGRARRVHRLEFAARSAAHGPRADVERAEGFLDSSIHI